MKKVFTFLLVVLFGTRVVSQTVIYSDDCSSAGSFSLITSDWAVGDFSGLGVPVCTVAGSSGGSYLVTQQISTSFEQVVTQAVNTTTFINIVATWNMYRNSSSSPSVTFEWSNNAGASWNSASYSHTASVGAWGAVPTVSLPAGASGGTVYLRWTYTGTGNFNDYVLIDDIKISGTPNPSYYWNGSGPITSVTSWGVNTDGSGTNPVDFTTNNQNFYLVNASTATLAGNWTFGGSGSVLNIGDGSVAKAINFTIPAGFTLTISSGAKLSPTNNSTITIVNTDFPALTEVQLGSLSSVNFAQTTGTTNIWATTYGNLSLTGGGVKAQSGVTTVSGTFVIGSGVAYAMSNSPFATTSLNGAIVCTGSISANSSNLSIGGSSVNPIGTINFSGTGSIAALLLNRATQTLTLGNNLTLSGGLSGSQFTNGNLNLNGKLLTINAAVTLPASASNGVFIGSSTSSLTISGSGAITNSLFMSQASTTARTLVFTLNRSSVTLPLGNDLISTTTNLSAGRLNLNGKSYTISGALTLPTSTTNGYFIGSTTSTLIIGGSGAITNSLLIDQTNASSRSLATFSLTRSGVTVPLGNNLTVSSLLDVPNGIININGNLLTLSGDINFPISAFGRGFQGSTSSSLTINGSGTISNSMFMSTTIQLADLTLNRTGQTLTLGNTLETYGVVNILAGTLATGNNLFIRSTATNKGRIGPISGVLSGNIKVETFAAGGVTDWTNLGVSGVSGLDVSAWEGQIPMTCSLCPNDQNSAGGYFVSIQRWDATKLAADPTAYVEMTYTSPLNPAEGYWVFLGTGLGTTSDMTWTVTGPPVQGVVNIPLSAPVPMSVSENYNLISNPYPSPISWTALWNNNADVDNAIYVYSPEAGGTTSFAGGVASDPVNGITNTIPMGQGFYVQAINAATLVATESVKTSGNEPLLKTAEDIGSVVRLRVDGGGFYDMTAIRFHGDATNGFDRKIDARKIFGSPGYLGYPGPYTQRTSISTRSGSDDYSINSLPYAQSADAVIQVLVKVYATGQHTITGSELENLPNSCVILKDKLTNTTHDLKTGPYVCEISDTTNTPRFELRVCMDIAMSIDNNQAGAVDQSILINRDANGVYVKFDYDKATRSKISVTNLLGQKVIEDKDVTTLNDKVYLNIDEKQQLIFISVTNDTQKVTRKMIR